MRHRLTVVGLGLGLWLMAVPSAQQAPPPPAVTATQVARALPDKLSDAEYWALIESLSEPGGTFRSDNLVSNEIYMQSIIPELQTVTRPGRVYLGVGPEQNFTYIVALKPRMVFIIDIRRGNLHTQLMYKALFELSKDRADFVSKLFSKKRPDGLTSKTTAQELFAAFSGVESSEALYKENLAAIQEHLTRAHEFPLSKDDLEGIAYVYYNFYWFGPSLTYSSSSGGTGGRGNFVNYQALMVADDGAGVSRSFLANDENFMFMKDLETKNLLVPVVGNFGGPKAIRSVGKYVRDRDGLVSAFYLSNVEQYLDQQGLWYAFCGNFAALPLDESSTFIYSQSGGNGGGGGGNLLSWYRPILADVKANKCDAGGPSSPGR
ncbi:MAG: hypothetical protein EXQ49_09985 [Acidobacteria bacterium]|nr:hypothetical protein [Acidobacteriota bacterium]